MARSPEHQQRGNADQVRQLPSPVDGPFEQDGPDQKQQRPADQAEHGLKVAVARGMRQHQFVADRGDDDAGHDRHVEIRVGQPGDPAGILGGGNPLGAGLGALVEIDPPHRDAADKGRDERADGLECPGQVGECGAGDHDGFTERDEDESGATLGQVTTLDSPVVDGGRPEARRAKPHHRPEIFDDQRDDPEHEPGIAIRQAARDPQHAAAGQPDQDADEVQPHRRLRGRNQPERVRRTARLDRGKCDTERQPAGAECARQRSREHKAGEHQQKQQDANRRLLGIEPVGDPGGVDPGPPHREEQQRDMQHARRREILQQSVRDLGDGEHEHQVEEQFDRSHAGMPIRRALPHHRGARRLAHVLTPRRTAVTCPKLTLRECRSAAPAHAARRPSVPSATDRQSGAAAPGTCPGRTRR